MKFIPVRKISSATNVDGTGRFSIRELREVLKNGKLVHEIHKHDFYFLLALLRGKGSHEIDFVPFKVQDHSVFILRPGQVHRLELEKGSEGYVLEFDSSFYKPDNARRWKKVTGKNYCSPDKTRFQKLYGILKNIHAEYLVREEGYRDAIKVNLDLFFIEYARQSKEPRTIQKKISNYNQERFEELSELLEKNICEMKNVSGYADQLHLSSYQLNIITKSAVGKTVSELINEQIILQAKRYLLATSNQVKDIAGELGYDDASYFIRFFKKHTGMSPETFRRNFR